MEQARKHLKTSSFLVLLLTAITFIEMLIELIFGGFKNAPIPEGAPENIIMITTIIICVFAVIFMLPQIYVGIKGLRIAKKPDSSTRHIFWAKVIFVIAIINIISCIFSLIKGDNSRDQISMLFSFVLEATVYFDYIKQARIVAKEQ